MKDTESPEIGEIKQGARWLWSQGDYPVIARILESPATDLAQRVVRPGSKVLDVAAGNGNFAIAAARCGAVVTATDFSPRMVELGRARADAEGLSMSWREADAESLPFRDGDFDIAVSVFGAIFAPRPQVVASELFRVVLRGGTVAMVNYGAGYFQLVSELIGRFSTRTGLALPSPFLWGEEDEVRRRFAPYAKEIDFKHGTLSPQYGSFEEWRDRFASANPPLRAMKASLPAPAYEGLERDVWALYEETSESDYLTVVATSLPG